MLTAPDWLAPYRADPVKLCRELEARVAVLFVRAEYRAHERCVVVPTDLGEVRVAVGSGSTVSAAERLHASCLAAVREVLPCDESVERIEAVTDQLSQWVLRDVLEKLGYAAAFEAADG